MKNRSSIAIAIMIFLGLSSARCGTRPAAAPAAELSKEVSPEHITELKRAMREEIRWGVLLQQIRGSRRFEGFDWSALPNERAMLAIHIDASFSYTSLKIAEKSLADGHTESAQRLVEEVEQSLVNIRRDRKRIVRDLLERAFDQRNEGLLNDAEYRGGKMQYDIDAEPAVN